MPAGNLSKVINSYSALSNDFNFPLYPINSLVSI